MLDLTFETRVLSHSRSSDRQTDTKLSTEVKVRKLTSSLCYDSELSDTDAGIFVNALVIRRTIQGIILDFAIRWTTLACTFSVHAPAQYH